MTKRIYFLLLACVSFASCTPIMKMMYGIKDPDIENEKSIKKTALKCDMDTSNIATVAISGYLSALKGRGIPDCNIYDRNGKYIEYRQTDTSCNAGLFDFIPALRIDGKYSQPDTTSMAEELSGYRDLRGNALPDLGVADYYVFIYWAVWAGKLNKDHVKIWEDLAKANTNCKIKVLKVNMDMQESWNPDDRDRLVNALSKKPKGQYD